MSRFKRALIGFALVTPLLVLPVGLSAPHHTAAPSASAAALSTLGAAQTDGVKDCANCW